MQPGIWMGACKHGQTTNAFSQEAVKVCTEENDMFTNLNMSKFAKLRHIPSDEALYE